MKETISYYLHGSKEDNAYYWFEKLKSEKDEVPDAWKYAFYEVSFEVEVDTETGEYKIISINCSNNQRFKEEV